MSLNKYGAPPVNPMVDGVVGNPQPSYVPLADVSFGPLQVVLPHQLPPTSMVFPAAWYNGMLNIPGVNVLYDHKRNGVAF